MYVKRRAGYFCYVKKVTFNKVHNDLLALLVTHYARGFFHLLTCIPWSGKVGGISTLCTFCSATTACVQERRVNTRLLYPA